MDDLASVNIFHFGMFAKSVRKCFCKCCKHHCVHFHVLLDAGQPDRNDWFGKQIIERLKVGILIINPEMTICICVAIFIFLFACDWFSEYYFEFIIVCKQTKQSKHGISKHSIIHIMEKLFLKYASFFC